MFHIDSQNFHIYIFTSFVWEILIYIATQHNFLKFGNLKSFELCFYSLDDSLTSGYGSSFYYWLTLKSSVTWFSQTKASPFAMWLSEVERFSLEIGLVHALDGTKILGTKSITGCLLPRV